MRQRVYRKARIAKAARAVKAEAASDIERQNYPVTDVYGSHRRAHFFDYAHIFVSEYLTRLYWSATLVHVQIATADGRGRKTQDRVGGFLDFGVVDRFDCDGVGRLPDDGFHELLLGF
jgi:hypothetical protein